MASIYTFHHPEFGHLALPNDRRAWGNGREETGLVAIQQNLPLSEHVEEKESLALPVFILVKPICLR